MEQIWKQGFEQGFEQGFKQGITQANVEIVTRMADSGLSYEQIAQATGLSGEKVAEIAKGIKN